VTDDVAAVTPQTPDDFLGWAHNISFGFGWLLQALYLLCFYCVYKDCFLDFAGMAEVFKNKSGYFFKYSMHVCVVFE
jgi:hypothetical protein